MYEQTLVILKPDAVVRGLIGQIIGRIENAGYKIVRMQLFNGCIENIDDKLYEHYGTISQLGVRAGEEILHANISYMLLGPIIAMVVEGPNVIAGIRKLVGATAPEAAAPGTIRGDFCPAIGVEDSKRRVHGKALSNLIHASSSAGDAEAEIKLWFGKMPPLNTWKTTEELFYR